MTTTPPAESLIEFPCEFPIKVMGVSHDGFAQAIVEIVMQHDEKFDPATVEMRPSKAGNYIALTCTIWTTSKGHLDDVYMALTSHPSVKFVL